MLDRREFEYLPAIVAAVTPIGEDAIVDAELVDPSGVGAMLRGVFDGVPVVGALVEVAWHPPGGLFREGRWHMRPPALAFAGSAGEEGTRP